MNVSDIMVCKPSLLALQTTFALHLLSSVAMSIVRSLARSDVVHMAKQAGEIRLRSKNSCI
jgi:hypothetical protein